MATYNPEALYHKKTVSSILPVSVIQVKMYSIRYLLCDLKAMEYLFKEIHVHPFNLAKKLPSVYMIMLPLYMTVQ